MDINGDVLQTVMEHDGNHGTDALATTEFSTVYEAHHGFRVDLDHDIYIYIHIYIYIK